VTSARHLAPPIPFEILELIDDERNTREWTDDQRRVAMLFLRATHHPQDPWTLSDADLIELAAFLIDVGR
jgi:hypothetical protein